MKKSTLGAFFRKLRERAKKSQSDVADMLKVSPQHVCDYEAGRRAVAHDRLECLLTYLNASENEVAKVYQAYGALPVNTVAALLKVPELWDVDPDVLLRCYKESLSEKQ